MEGNCENVVFINVFEKERVLDIFYLEYVIFLFGGY